MKNQQTIALTVGYLLVALLFFNLGNYAHRSRPPDIRIEEPSVDLSQIYNSLKTAEAQSPAPAQSDQQIAGETLASDCQGKIKGNIGSSGKIYHLPGGAFYSRTIPELCFDNETEAQKAGFRKSSR
ncbi:MAG: hypothetical protein HY396_01405 [Candidatus Doudnabacteria bacterium]|nr:hypothetical protein [Candidatus Doudnabacteria bacterium]